jgi:hypothetical protein
VTPGLLLLVLLQAATPDGGGALVAQGRPLPAPEAILDLAFLDDRRFLALAQGTLYLYRLDDGGPTLESRLVLPGEFLPVRGAAGVLRVAESEGACWALSNRRERASLVALEGRRLVLRLEATAIPWPGSAVGLRYRAGTNELLLDDGAYFSVREDGLAVTDRGTLVAPDRPDLQGRRSGTALTRLGNAIVAASPRPPDASDAILVFAPGEAPRETPVAGTVSALSGRVRRGGGVLVAAVQMPEGESQLVVFEAERAP